MQHQDDLDDEQFKFWDSVRAEADEWNMYEPEAFATGYLAGAAAALGLLGMAEEIGGMEERRQFKALLKQMESWGIKPVGLLP